MEPGSTVVHENAIQQNILKNSSISLSNSALQCWCRSHWHVCHHGDGHVSNACTRASVPAGTREDYPWPEAHGHSEGGKLEITGANCNTYEIRSLNQWKLIVNVFKKQNLFDQFCCVLAASSPSFLTHPQPRLDTKYTLQTGSAAMARSLSWQQPWQGLFPDSSQWETRLICGRNEYCNIGTTSKLCLKLNCSFLTDYD